MTDPTRPSYQGRPLPRPAEEVVDQGLRFDLGTWVTRRRVLGVLGAGAATAGLASCGVAATDTPSDGATTADGEIPEETAGPYPGDGSNGPDVLEDSGVVRSDITTSFGTASGTAEGVAMTLALTVVDLAADRPFAGVAVYVWHCTADGGYSMYSEGMTEENFLRGVQVADDRGRVEFTSIVPGCYAGRWPHVHFEVYPDLASITDAAEAIATSQVALPPEVCEAVYRETGYEGSTRNMSEVSLTSDNVFGDDGGVSQLATATGDVAAGYQLSLQVPVDTGTPAGGGGGPGGGGPGGGGPGTRPSGGPGTGTPPAGGPGR